MINVTSDNYPFPSSMYPLLGQVQIWPISQYIWVFHSEPRYPIGQPKNFINGFSAMQDLFLFWTQQGVDVLKYVNYIDSNLSYNLWVVSGEMVNFFNLRWYQNRFRQLFSRLFMHIYACSKDSYLIPLCSLSRRNPPGFRSDG